MSTSRFISVCLAAMLLVTSGLASAHGPRARIGVGVYVGPAWGPYWGPGSYWGPRWDPFWYPPPVVVVRPEPPPVYVEQQEALAETAQQYWYYCPSGKGYYPYVKECPEGWQRVLPQPAQ